MMMPQPTTTTTTSAGSAAEEEKVCTLRIGDLEPWMSENYIYLCFEPTGEVFTSRVIRDEKTGKSECFGYIQFETHAIAERILHKFNGTHMPMVIGNLFTLDWAVSDIFTTTYHNNNKSRHLPQQQQQQESTITGRKCGRKKCRLCSPFPIICITKPDWLPESIKEVAKPGSYPNWEALSTHGDSYENSYSARRLAAQAARRIVTAATNKKKTVVVVDAAQRVHQIAAFLKMHPDVMAEQGVTLDDLLDELKGYVKSIDVANELHSTDALSHLLLQLSYTDTGIRAKVAELVTAMVHNNPRGQQLVWEGNGLHYLFDSFISGSDATARTNAFYAISSLIWNNEPGIAEFGRRNGYVELRDALLSSVSVAFQRKALDLIRHLLHVNSSDYNIVTESGFPSIIMYLLSISDDAEVREAALGCLLVLARVEEEVGGNSGQLIKNNDKLKQVLQGLRVKGISAMAPEDLGGSRKERQLVDSLWNACYNKPSSFREKDHEEDSQEEDAFCIENISGSAHKEVDFDKSKNLELSGDDPTSESDEQQANKRLRRAAPLDGSCPSTTTGVPKDCYS